MKNEEILKFLKSVFIVLCGCVCVDLYVGVVGNRLLRNVPNTTSEIACTNYCMTEATADVVIIGSSRANHHYVSSLIADSLNMTVYNAGRDGMDFIYNSCTLYSIIRRHAPKIVIFDAAEHSLNGKLKDRITSLSAYYYTDDYVQQTINHVKPYAKMLYASNMIRFNDKLLKIINAYISPPEKLSGYMPLTPNNRQLPPAETSNETLESIDDEELACLMDIIRWSNEYGFKLIIVDSPRFKLNNQNYSVIRPICEQNGILCIDNSNLPYFMERPELFNDTAHLNSIGAEIYTQIFIGQIST